MQQATANSLNEFLNRAEAIAETTLELSEIEDAIWALEFFCSNYRDRRGSVKVRKSMKKIILKMRRASRIRRGKSCK